MRADFLKDVFLYFRRKPCNKGIEIFEKVCSVFMSTGAAFFPSSREASSCDHGDWSRKEIRYSIGFSFDVSDFELMSTQQFSQLHDSASRSVNMIVMTGAARMCWIYFMKLKYEVADIFVKFKAWVETQSRCKMQVIRSDNGTKDTFEKFNKFCEDAGIEHQLTAPYTPQQNGVVERKNRTLMEMARSLLCDKGLPKKFWAEAVNTVVFLLNRLPTKALQKKTPFEAWYGYKPKLLNLKIFGCLCHPSSQERQIRQKCRTWNFCRL